MADNASKRGEQAQNRRGRTSAILAQITERELKLIKVEINRYHIPKIANPPPLVTAIDNVKELTLHRTGEGERPIFDRDDIVVNKEEPEERIIVHDRRRRTRSRTRKSQDRSSSDSSSSRGRSSRSRSSSSTKRRKSRYKSRSVEKTSDSGKTKDDRCPHSRIDLHPRDRSTFRLEGIFKNIPNRPSPSRSRKDQNVEEQKSSEEYKEKYRKRPESREEGPSKRHETERDRYYRERERDKRSRENLDIRDRRRTPPHNYSRRSRSPHFSKNVSSQSRSPYHSRRRNSRSPSLHSKRYSRSPRRSRSKERHRRSLSAPRKKYSRSPERLKDDRSYRRSPYNGPPERRSSYGRPRERTPYRSRSSPHRDNSERGYKSRKEGYRGSQRSNSPSRSDKKELFEIYDTVAGHEESNITPEYGYIEGQHVWYPGHLPYPPFGMRPPGPYQRFPYPMIRPLPIPMSPRQPNFRARLPIYNRPFRPKSATITSSTAAASGVSTSQEKKNESQITNLSSSAPSDSNKNLGNSVTETTSGIIDNSTGESSSQPDNGNSIIPNTVEVSEDSDEGTSSHLVEEPEDTKKS